LDYGDRSRMKEDWYVLDVVAIFQPFPVDILKKGSSCYGTYMVQCINTCRVEYHLAILKHLTSTIFDY